jgi:hypothetical protein
MLKSDQLTITSCSLIGRINEQTFLALNILRQASIELLGENNDLIQTYFDPLHGRFNGSHGHFSVNLKYNKDLDGHHCEVLKTNHPENATFVQIFNDVLSQLLPEFERSIARPLRRIMNDLPRF